MYIDYHSHILPYMDDGSKSIEVTKEMLDLEYVNNVQTIVLTPHYYGYKEEITTFINRRIQSYNLLQNNLSPMQPIKLYLGAEVYLTKNLSNLKDIKSLCIENTNILMIEMPYEPLNQWMVEEIENIMFSHSIRIMFAHIDRYLKIFNKNEYNLLFSIEDAIFQINNEAMNSRKKIKFIKQLQKLNIPLVFGSDSHNLGARAPNFNLITQNIKKIDYSYCKIYLT